MSLHKAEIIKAILTNNTLSEDKKSEIIAEIIEEFQKTYPDLQYHATKADVKESELKLTKEIEEVRNEIKEVELKLTREIEEVRKEIKEVDVRLTKEIGEVKAGIAKSKAETIKFVAGMMIGQVFVIAGLVAGIFKYFIQ